MTSQLQQHEEHKEEKEERKKEAKSIHKTHMIEKKKRVAITHEKGFYSAETSSKSMDHDDKKHDGAIPLSSHHFSMTKSHVSESKERISKNLNRLFKSVLEQQGRADLLLRGSKSPEDMANEKKIEDRNSAIEKEYSLITDEEENSNTRASTALAAGVGAGISDDAVAEAERIRKKKMKGQVEYAYEGFWQGSRTCLFEDYFEPDPLFPGSMDSAYHYGVHLALQKCMISADSDVFWGNKNDETPNYLYVKVTEGEKNEKDLNNHYIVEQRLYTDKKCMEPANMNNTKISYADLDGQSHENIFERTVLPKSCTASTEDAEEIGMNLSGTDGILAEVSAFGGTKNLYDAVNNNDGVTFNSYPSRNQCRNYEQNRKLTIPPNAVPVLETLTVPPCTDIYNDDRTEITAAIWTTCDNHVLGYDLHVFQGYTCQEVFGHVSHFTDDNSTVYPEYTVIPMNNMMLCENANPLVASAGFIALSCPPNMDSGPTIWDNIINWMRPVLPESIFSQQEPTRAPSPFDDDTEPK